MKVRGGVKIAADKIGISVEEYLQNVNSGLKWCSTCKTFLSRDFFFDSTTRRDGKLTQCKECARVRRRNNYKQNPPKKMNCNSLQRDGDKIQARYSVRHQIRSGKLPHAQTLPCIDCGHIGHDLLHEYDHYLGYAGINHLNVQCVCNPCHRKREQQRRKQQQIGNAYQS